VSDAPNGSEIVLPRFLQRKVTGKPSSVWTPNQMANVMTMIIDSDLPGSEFFACVRHLDRGIWADADE